LSAALLDREIRQMGDGIMQLSYLKTGAAKSSKCE